MRGVLNRRRIQSLFGSSLALVVFASVGCVSASQGSLAGETVSKQTSAEGLTLGLDEALHESLPQDESAAVVSEDTSHIHELGGEDVLDASAEQEVEATSVDDTAELADEASERGIPVVHNERVEWWVEYFTGKGRTRFQMHLDRADSYRPLVHSVLRSQDVPEDLLYLALIESGFSTAARSHAGAVGIWQFIRGTGKRYGLVVNRAVDERRDPVRSTQAAARYLSDLYNIFGDWYLAFAAYNCGEFRVLRAITSGNTRDFWKLSEMKLLPKETRHYVPKFLAAMRIAKNRAQFGFVNNDVVTVADLAAVRVEASTSLQLLAAATGVSHEELKSLNPHLLTRMTPPNVKNYSVWIPASAASSIDSASLNVVLADAPERFSSVAEEIVPVYHTVRRGETLSSIARSYGTTVQALKAMNDKRSSSLRVGERLAVSSDQRAATQVARGPSSKQKRIMEAAGRADELRSASNENSSAQEQIHVVQRGDYLAKIAEKYKVSVASLKSANGVRSSRIFPGMSLKIPGRSSTSASDYVMYRVRRGDSLSKIGKRFGVQVDQIKAANEIAQNDIFAGQVLRVPSGGS